MNMSDTSGRAPSSGSRPSYIQEMVWLLDEVSRHDGPAYNEPVAFHIEGRLDVVALRRALHRLVERHEPLRTTFMETKDGLTAVVHADMADFVEMVDLRHLDRDELSARAEELVADSYRRPFDLDAGPPLRAIVLRLAGDEAVLGLTVHHIATDGWSMRILLSELGDEYVSLCRTGRPADLPALHIRYRDHALRLREQWERGDFAEKTEQWKRALENAPELLRLPIDRARPPVQTFRGATRAIRIPRSRIAELTERCHRECRTTEFMTLFSAYAVLLHRYTGQNAVTIGTSLLNRTSPDVLNVVGCFVNPAALVLRIHDGMTFRELLAQGERVVLETLKRQDAPYPKVLASLDIQRDPSHSPVFQTMFTLGPRFALDLGEGTSCRPFPVRRCAAKFELLLDVREVGDDIELEAEYNTDLFNAGTVDRMLRHYALLVERLADDIDVAVSGISFIPDDERRLILDVWNDTRAEYPGDTVIDLVEAQVERTPHAIAVESEERALTYAALNEASARLAGLLVERMRDRSSPFVGVLMERSLEMVVAIVAIVKAGLAYVPVDPEYPRDRVRFMIEDAELPLILTQERHRFLLQGVEAEVLVPADWQHAAVAGDLTRDLSSDSPVYMIYTSGSTGRPKGVVNRHVSLFNRLFWMQSTYGLTADDCVLQKTPFSFDVSVWEFFWPLMFGARIVVAAPGGHRDPGYLRRVIRDRGITTLHFVPSMLNVFLEDDEDLRSWCASLRRVFCSGEALPYPTVERFFQRIGCELHNLYGPTEAAIDVSHWPCSLDYPGGIVPIGRPIANVQLYVLDRHLALQPIGVTGELCIGGVGLAAGYHRRPELNELAFTANPYATGPETRLYRTGDLARFLPDGQIEYLGRIDGQVKLRGFRIELGEIEAAVRALPGVRDAAVVLHETRAIRMLVAYLVADEFEQRDALDALRTRLPDFMIPQMFVELPNLSKSANGKLDRRALPDPFAGGRGDEELIPPATAAEQAVVQVWRQVLGVERVGVDSNFFRLGGDSIMSVRVAAQLRERGYAVEVHDLFAHTTVRQLARVLERAGAVLPPSPTAAPLCLVDQADRRRLGPGVDDAWPLTMLQAGMLYHAMRGQETAVYHDIFTFGIALTASPTHLLEAWRVIVARHPQLRSSFALDGFGEPLQLVHGDPVVPLELGDLAHLPRSEQDEAIGRWVAAEKTRPFEPERAPLFRLQVHVRSAREMSLTIAFHHAILDGWSVALLVQEFRRVYAALLAGRPVSLEPERVPFSAYVAMERQALRDPAQAAFWLDVASGVPAARLPRRAGSSRPVPASAERAVPETVASSLAALADDLGVPLKSALLAIHLRAMTGILDRSEVTTGLVVNGRPEVDGGEELAGLFLNTVPFPIELLPEDWPAFIRRVFAREQDLLPRRRFPLAEIQRRAGGDELFDVVFNYTDFHVYDRGAADGVEVTGATYFEQTSYELVVHLHRDHFSRDLRLIVRYDAGRVDDDLVQHYLDLYMETAGDLAVNAGGGAEVTRPPTRSAVREAGRRPTEPRTAAPARPAMFPPRTLLERQLCEVVAEVTGVDRVGIDDDYLELGIDSISAIRVVARMKRLNVPVTIEDLFQCRTVRAVAEWAGRAERAQRGDRGEERAGEPRVQPFELVQGERRRFPPAVVDAYPATSLQVEMIRQGMVDVEQAVYHDVFRYQLALPLVEGRLRDALSRVMNGHDTFRTAFSLDEYSVPMQLVFDTVQPQLEVVDLGPSPVEQQEALVDAWFDREKARGFDSARPGLIRFCAHRLGPSRFTLTLSFHHAIVDGWSLSLFVAQLVHAYVESLQANRDARLEFPGLRYRDYAAVELESRRSPALRAFWQERLEGCAVTALPRPRLDGDPARWSETRLVVDRARQEALTALCRRLGVPLKHALLACHLRVVALVCRQADVLTGLFTGCRLEQDDGERVLGLFLNFMPFRLWVADQSWRALVAETFENERRCLPYRRYPLSSIERDLGRERILETVFNYTHFNAYGDLARGPGRGDARAAGILEDVRWFEHTDFPLLVNAGHDLAQEHVTITLNAHGRVLPQRHVEVLGQLYEAAIAWMVEHEDAPIAEVPRDVAELIGILLEDELASSRGSAGSAGS
jgi:amino acid adenylation domain-containing protein